MSHITKHIYISADYDQIDGDLDVVKAIKSWGIDNLHSTNFIDMSDPRANNVIRDIPDCRICDIKSEFNRQISASSFVLFIVGRKTKDRQAGSHCNRCIQPQCICRCTPYQKNFLGAIPCKVPSITESCDGHVGCINSYSYLEHEFLETISVKRNNQIAIFYNSFYHQESWLPCYMKDYKGIAEPFWVRSPTGNKIGCYTRLKELLINV